LANGANGTKCWANVGGADGRVGCSCLVRRIDGGCWFGSIGDGVGDSDCMGGIGVVLAGKTNGDNGTKCRAKCWAKCCECMGGDVGGADGCVGCSFLGGGQMELHLMGW